MIYTVQGQGQGPTPYTYISIKIDSNKNRSGESSFIRKIKNPARAILIWVKFDWDIRVWGRPLALPLDSVIAVHNIINTLTPQINSVWVDFWGGWAAPVKIHMVY